MANIATILLIIGIVLILIALTLISINAYTVKKDVNYAVTSTLKSAYTICVIEIVLTGLIFIFSTTAAILFVHNDYAKDSVIILLSAINIILTAGAIIFSIILIFENKNIYAYAFTVILFICLILFILILLQVRKAQLYVINAKKDKEKELEDEVEKLKSNKPKVVVEEKKVEPLITENVFTTITDLKYVPIEQNSFVPFDISSQYS